MARRPPALSFEGVELLGPSRHIAGSSPYQVLGQFASMWGIPGRLVVRVACPQVINPGLIRLESAGGLAVLGHQHAAGLYGSVAVSPPFLTGGYLDSMAISTASSIDLPPMISLAKSLAKFDCIGVGSSSMSAYRA